VDLQVAGLIFSPALCSVLNRKVIPAFTGDYRPILYEAFPFLIPIEE
jgi:hypothetical protein